AYRIEYFLNQPDKSQGATFLGFDNVTTNESGLAFFDTLLPPGASAGQVVTATATDPYGNTSEFSIGKKVTVDTDGDGIPDEVESAGPNNGDANLDGILDSTQPQVATFPNADTGTSGYITLVAPDGFALQKVRPLENPAPDDPDAPAHVDFDLGFVN